MLTLEIRRIGNSSVADQMVEMKEWLAEAGIRPLNLEPTSILRARVGFRASFAGADEAARFRRRFDAEGAASPP
jgi:hypothetical protein